jgi:hypothetical protein
MSRGADKLKALLSNFQMLSTSCGLTKGGMDHSFEDVFLGCGGLHIFDQVMGLVDILMFEMIDDLPGHVRELERTEETGREGRI